MIEKGYTGPAWLVLSKHQGDMAPMKVNVIKAAEKKVEIQDFARPSRRSHLFTRTMLFLQKEDARAEVIKMNFERAHLKREQAAQKLKEAEAEYQKRLEEYASISK